MKKNILSQMIAWRSASSMELDVNGTIGYFNVFPYPIWVRKGERRWFYPDDSCGKGIGETAGTEDDVDNLVYTCKGASVFSFQKIKPEAVSELLNDGHSAVVDNPTNMDALYEQAMEVQKHRAPRYLPRKSEEHTDNRRGAISTRSSFSPRTSRAYTGKCQMGQPI